jgi:hypothetical protein
MDRDLKPVCVHDTTVVPERFEPGRLVVRRDERKPSYLQQFRGREEHHVHREMKHGIDEHSTFHDDVVEAALPRGNGRGQPGRPGTHDKHIANRHASSRIQIAET